MALFQIIGQNPRDLTNIKKGVKFMTYEFESVPGIMDGSVLCFPTAREPHNIYYFLKVCSRYGIGGVVRLDHGWYIPTTDLEDYGIDYQKAVVVAKNLDQLYETEEN